MTEEKRQKDESDKSKKKSPTLVVKKGGRKRKEFESFGADNDSRSRPNKVVKETTTDA